MKRLRKINMPSELSIGCGTTSVVILILVLLLGGCSSVEFIQPDERGVVISALSSEGYRSHTLQPGLRFIVPFAEQVITYSISKQTYTMSGIASEGQVSGDDSVTARTEDGQEIFIDASVIYSIDPAKVIDIHIQWQNRYTSDLVRPLARGIIRDIVSQFTVDEVVSTQRTEITDRIRERMSERLAGNGLILDDVVMRNITFSPEYAASVEQKQIAQQQAQQAQFVVEQRRQEAEQARQVAQGKADARLIEAKAEAEALRLIAETLAENPSLITYQYVEKLSPGIQVMLVPSESPFLLPIPTPPAQPQTAAPQKSQIPPEEAEAEAESEQ